jgi:regulator of protease activity HflC (stomatin/prohibitin superfamily)
MFSIVFFVLLSIVAFLGITVQLQKPIAGIAVAALIFIGGMLSCSFTVISAGHTGVQITLGEVNPQPLTEGVHFVNPISIVKDINTQLQKAVADSQTAGTKDLQQVHTDIVINYRMSPTNLPHIYKEFGLDIDNKILGPAINDAFKAVTGKYDSSELITKRDEVSQAILIHLREKVAPFDIVVSNVSLVNFGFSADYQKAIEAKVIATQQTAKAEQDLRRIEIEAKQAIAVAEGKARAIAIETQAINSQGGDNYVKLKQIEKWNGKYPDTVVNGSTGLMMNLGK